MGLFCKVASLYWTKEQVSVSILCQLPFMLTAAWRVQICLALCCGAGEPKQEGWYIVFQAVRLTLSAKIDPFNHNWHLVGACWPPALYLELGGDTSQEMQVTLFLMTSSLRLEEGDFCAWIRMHGVGDHIRLVLILTDTELEFHLINSHVWCCRGAALSSLF